MTHVNGQLYIQVVEEKQPAVTDQYNKVTKPGTDRISNQVVEIKLQGETVAEILTKLRAHLDVLGT